jgi:hypothetical protein
VQADVVVWAAGALGIALLAALCVAWVTELRTSPRRTDVDWPAAVLLQIGVVATATADLLLPNVLFAGPADRPVPVPQTVAAAAAILGFAGAILLLRLHRRRPLRDADTTFWRRSGVVAPGFIGYVALGVGTWLSVGQLPPALLLAFAAPALGVLLGLVLLARGLAVLTAGAPAPAPTAAPDTPQPAPEPASVAEVRPQSVGDSTGQDRFRRPTDL